MPMDPALSHALGDLIAVLFVGLGLGGIGLAIYRAADDREYFDGLGGGDGAGDGVDDDGADDNQGATP